MEIIDAQVHMWAADRPDRPWPKDSGSNPHRPEPFEEPSLLAEMKAAGVDGVILVPPLWEGHRNDLSIAAAERDPRRFGIMGKLDFMDPASRGKLARWREQPGMLGVRLSFTSPRYLAMLKEGLVDWVWGEAERARVPLYVLHPHHEMHIMDEVAARHPSLKIVLNHMGLTGHAVKDDAAFSEFDRVLDMAKHPNVAVTASALPYFSTDQYPYRSLHKYLRQAHDAFGPKRMFWGTDMTRCPITYRQHVTMFTEEIPWLGSDDKEWIMGRGLVEWLGWKRG